MLKSLHIQNYALIEDLEIDFQKGLNIITGETGAGKSILLGALGLLSGKRADSSVLRGEGKKCVIEGEFQLGAYGLDAWFDQNDLDFESSTLVRREINASGKSRAFVNDTPVNLSVLKELGESLIDIHSQHANLMLADPKFGFSVLDLYAGNQKELTKYQGLYEAWLSDKKKLQELEEIQQKEKLNLEFYQFQFNELKAANLKEGEQEELEKEFEVLNNAEDIKLNGAIVANNILHDSNSVLDKLGEAEVALEKLSDFSEDYSDLKNRLSSSLIDLQDLAEDVEQKASSIAGDSQKVQEIDDRLGLLFGLQKKYIVSSVEGLIEKREELANLVSLAGGDSEELEKLRLKITDTELKLKKLSKDLTKSRVSAAKAVTKSIVSDLVDLGILQAQFDFNIKECELNAYGADELTLVFSANKGKALSELSKTASGGELSRVMLSLKRILSSKSSLPTIVFDEIDTGVSGEVADRMGQLMKSMGEEMQVVTITHLPQIAAKGNAHFKVFKSHDQEITSSQMKELSKKERVEEIAQMLSGAKITKAALENANELLG